MGFLSGAGVCSIWKGQKEERHHTPNYAPKVTRHHRHGSGSSAAINVSYVPVNQCCLKEERLYQQDGSRILRAGKS